MWAFQIFCLWLIFNLLSNQYLHAVYIFLIFYCLADLRDDKQFFIDHPGAVPITTAQVILIFSLICGAFMSYMITTCLSFHILQGEELRKLIGAPAYIECSSKTQQVCHFISTPFSFLCSMTCHPFTKKLWYAECQSRLRCGH